MTLPAIYRSANGMMGLLMLFLVTGIMPGYGEDIEAKKFDGKRAMLYIEELLSFGPRFTGSSGHARTIAWLKETLEEYEWEVSVQKARFRGRDIQNVVARRGKGRPFILLGTHYDTRIYADEDPDPKRRRDPVPGANDGASGVAVLVELARVCPRPAVGEVRLVFFDAEDNGNIERWDWCLGSRAYVKDMQKRPDAVIVVDMVGDADLELYFERNSHPGLSREIWREARRLGHEKYFIPRLRHRIIDDHLPFASAGIPAVNIIDFDYLPWHTTADTLDKVSARSLEMVGETVLSWLQGRTSEKK